MDNKITDVELMRAHCAGNPGAFAELVSRHQSRLWLTAWSVLRDSHDAKDAVQDGLIRAFRAADSWRGGSVAGWLHRIVSRVALDRSIAQSRHAAEPLEELDTASTSVRDNAADAVAERVVQAVVASLPVEQRECFVRIDLLGFTFAEVAADLGLPDGTVRSRRARGKARLLEALRDAGLVGPHRPRQGSVLLVQPTDQAGLPQPRSGEQEDDPRACTSGSAQREAALPGAMTANRRYGSSGNSTTRTRS